MESRPGKRRGQEGCPPAATRHSLLFPSTRDLGAANDATDANDAAAAGDAVATALTVVASFAALEAGAPPPPGAAAADDETSRQSKETEKSRPSTETAAEAKAADAEPSRPSTETETTESLRFRNNDTVVAEGENDKSYDDGNKLGGGDDDEESSENDGAGCGENGAGNAVDFEVSL